jgi:hypothetical protein
LKIKLDENLPTGLVHLLTTDARAFAPGTHQGILLVRLPQPGRTALSERVATLFRGEDVDSWAGCLVTATLRKVRVKRPV